MVDPDHAALSITCQCRQVSIARSSFYYEGKGESPLNLQLRRRIDEQFLETPFYGSRQMTRWLLRQGAKVSRKRVRRLMRLLGLQAVLQRPRTSQRHPEHRIYPYLLSRSGDSTRPNQVGTAIATLVRKGDHAPAGEVGFRHLWGQAKHVELMATAETEPSTLYDSIEPVLPLGLPFVPTAVSEGWFDWPALPELFPAAFPGVKTSRDGFLVDIDLDCLRTARCGLFRCGFEP